MNSLSTAQTTERSRSEALYDVVVVGAGPYGLSAASHLMGKGLKVAIFGKPLELWREKMPEGMFLRSHWWGTNLSDPEKKYGFEQFFQESNYGPCYPVPIQMFIDYAQWFQERAVPNVDTTFVSSIERSGEQFVLTLVDGRVVVASAVVMAVGLSYYKRLPAEFAHISPELAAHSNDHKDFSIYAGKKLAIIGGGQSGVEYSAMLHEIGASSVDLITRHPIMWLDPDNDDPRSLLTRVLLPNSAIAPGWQYWFLEAFPYFFTHLPVRRKARIVKNNHHPAGSEWLMDRVIGHVNLHEGHRVTQMVESDGGVKLDISDNTQLQVDHVMLATGYEADVKRLPMLGASILSEIKDYLGSPILNPWFESSVPGLYFLGFSSLQSFGPLYRFVAGVPATAPRVASAVARRVAVGR